MPMAKSSPAMLSPGNDDHGKLRRCDHYKAVP
jgi:hypothetical protein